MHVLIIIVSGHFYTVCIALCAVTIESDIGDDRDKLVQAWEQELSASQSSGKLWNSCIEYTHA